MRRGFSSWFRTHVWRISAIALCILAIWLLDIGCPFRYLFHIPCPTCGSTRALLALCRLDLPAYLAYQPFSLPLVAAVWLMLHVSLFPRKGRRWVYGVVFAVAGGNFLYYILRLCGAF